MEERGKAANIPSSMRTSRHGRPRTRSSRGTATTNQQLRKAGQGSTMSDSMRPWGQLDTNLRDFAQSQMQPLLQQIINALRESGIPEDELVLRAMMIMDSAMLDLRQKALARQRSLSS